MKGIAGVGLVVVLLLLAGGLTLSAQAVWLAQEPPPPRPGDEALIAQLNEESSGTVRISYHSETGRVRFIGTSPARPIRQPTPLMAVSPETGARRFLSNYGQLFGLRDPDQELVVLRERVVDRRRSFVRFQQVYRGIPVLAGELIVGMDARLNVLSASGEILPDLELSVAPAIESATARVRALEVVARNYDLAVGDLKATEPALWIYNPALLGGPGPRLSRLVWRMEVAPLELLPIDELVLVDAQIGSIALHFNQIDAVKSRKVYDAGGTGTLPGTLRRSEGQPAYGDTDVDAAYDYSGDAYDFYSNRHGRDGLDNAGMVITSTTHFDDGSCPNAYWNGEQMVFCDGLSRADDVVAHEYTHGVTQYESGLFYYMQSGAINEGFSDIWGEFVDLTNSAGTDTPGVRWQIGEDEPNFGTIRDMKNPTAYSLPDKMTSSYYYCGEADNGGVHTNNGVASKAAYLMVDGDSFNGYVVAGIGITKTAKIWYEVQTNQLTSGADYEDLYDGLNQACFNLIGTSGIIAADCQEVQDATDATVMDRQPISCAANDAPPCWWGSPSSTLFYDDMETPASSNWISTTMSGSNEWYYPQNSNPYGYDMTYATSGAYNIWGYDQSSVADYSIAMTSDVTLPSTGRIYMHFNHAYGFDDGVGGYYDGGLVEYSTDGGTTWSDAGPFFTYNGYNGAIATGVSNALGGRDAFVGESYGYVSSRLSLAPLAGQNVRFRFRISTDTVVDDIGWFIDDVGIYVCPSAPEQVYLPLVVRNYSSSCSGGQVVQNGGFESEHAAWIQQSGLYHLFDTFWPYSGSWHAYLGYYNDADDRLYQTIAVPPGVSSARLTLYLLIGTDDSLVFDHDYFHVELQDALGSTLESFLWADNTMQAGWLVGTKEWSDFSAHAGQTRRLFFQATNDSEDDTAFLVDDVTLWTYCGSLSSAAAGEVAGSSGWTWQRIDAPPGRPGLPRAVGGREP